MFKNHNCAPVTRYEFSASFFLAGLLLKKFN